MGMTVRNYLIVGMPIDQDELFERSEPIIQCRQGHKYDQYHVGKYCAEDGLPISARTDLVLKKEFAGITDWDGEPLTPDAFTADDFCFDLEAHIYLLPVAPIRHSEGEAGPYVVGKVIGEVSTYRQSGPMSINQAELDVVVTAVRKVAERLHLPTKAIKAYASCYLSY